MGIIIKLTSDGCDFLVFLLFFRPVQNFVVFRLEIALVGPTQIRFFPGLSFSTNTIWGYFFVFRPF